MSARWLVTAALLAAALPPVPLLAGEFEPVNYLRSEPALARQGGLRVTDGVALAVVPVPSRAAAGPADIRLRAEEGAKTIARGHLIRLVEELIGLRPPVQGVAAAVTESAPLAAIAWFQHPALASHQLERELPTPTPTATATPTATPTPTVSPTPSRTPTTPPPTPTPTHEAQATPSPEALLPRATPTPRPALSPEPSHYPGESPDQTTAGRRSDPQEIPDSEPDPASVSPTGPPPVSPTPTPPPTPTPTPTPSCEADWFEGFYPDASPAVAARLVRVCGGRPNVGPGSLLESRVGPAGTAWGSADGDRLLAAVDRGRGTAALFSVVSYQAGCWCWTRIQPTASPGEEKRLGGEMRSVLRRDSSGTSIVTVAGQHGQTLLDEAVSVARQIDPSAVVGLTADDGVLVLIAQQSGETQVFRLATRFVDMTGREIRRYQQVSASSIVDAPQ